MNDLIIKVSKRSRLIDLDHSTLGIVGENLQEKLVFVFQDEFVDGMARLEYELNGEKRYVLMEKVGQSYILPVQNVLLTKEGNIDLQLVITEDKTGTPVFKSEVFTLYCKKSIEAVGEAPSSYELWIEKANRILLEASRVNIDGKKTGNETLITITQRDGNKKSFPILDGQDGQDGQDGNGIVSIEKTSTSTLVDTYTITFTDGTTTTFEVTNGNGIVSIEKTSTSGLVDTYTITFSDGTTTTYTVTNGETQDLSNYVQKTEFNESQATQDERTLELQAELERYKLLENALPHTENATPSDYVTLNNTAKAPMEISLTPQTSQDGEPTPDNPQDIHCTTGDNQIKVVGKNLFDIKLDSSITTTIIYKTFTFKPSTAYTISTNTFLTSDNTANIFAASGTSLNPNTSTNGVNGSRTVISDASGNITIGYRNYQSRLDYSSGNYWCQLEQSSSATPYTPYEETTYPISLGSKEMFDINNVSDGFVYDETEDKFYIERKNGKTTLDTTGWTRSAYNNIYYFFKAKPTNCKSAVLCLSNYFIYNASYTNVDNSLYVGTNNLIIGRPIVNGSYIEELSDFTNWLGSHNTEVVYQLATATLEEITDSTLISQLRTIKNALSMQGTTHIISTSSGTNLPFLIKARAVQTIERT